MDKAIAGNTPFTLVLDDPAGNSFVQALTDVFTDDKNLEIHKYTRSFEQNEELGLNDMKVENYEDDNKVVSKDLQTITEE